MSNKTDEQTNGYSQGQQTVVINQQEKQSNGMGVAGFVLALIALFLSWVPILNWITWILGLIFSFIGVFKKPRGLAVTGLVISLIGLVIMILFIGAFAAAVSTAAMDF